MTELSDNLESSQVQSSVSVSERNSPEFSPALLGWLSAVSPVVRSAGSRSIGARNTEENKRCLQLRAFGLLSAISAVHLKSISAQSMWQTQMSVGRFNLDSFILWYHTNRAGRCFRHHYLHSDADAVACVYCVRLWCIWMNERTHECLWSLIIVISRKIQSQHRCFFVFFQGQVQQCNVQ